MQDELAMEENSAGIEISMEVRAEENEEWMAKGGVKVMVILEA